MECGSAAVWGEAAPVSRVQLASRPLDGSTRTHPSARPPALIGFSPRGAAPQRNAVFRSAPHLHTVSFAYRLFVVDCEVGHVTANKNILKQLNIEIPKKTNKQKPAATGQRD